MLTVSECRPAAALPLPGLLDDQLVILPGGGTSGQWTVNNLIVTSPSITSARLVAAAKVLDSMITVDYDNVRFVLLAVHDPIPPGAFVLGLDRSGAVVATSRFSFPPPPASSKKNVRIIRAQGTSGGGNYRGVAP